MPHFYRQKILLDEGLPFPRSFRRTNARHNLKHVVEDFKKGGLKDEKVYELAIEKKRLLVIFNIKDYRKLATKSKNSGIIGISQNLTTDQVDKKLCALLDRSKEKTLYGKYTAITGETSL